MSSMNSMKNVQEYGQMNMEEKMEMCMCMCCCCCSMGYIRK